MLQFVAGLGPLKARNILSKLSSSDDELTIRKEIYTRKLVDKKVYENCIGFLKILPLKLL